MSRLDQSLLPRLPGTRMKNRALVASLGTASLDALLGGVPNTSIIVVDEAGGSRKFLPPIARCFLAEGIAERQTTFCAASTLAEAEKLLRNLPKRCEETAFDEGNSAASASLDDVDFRIAWRYNTMPKVDSSVHSAAKSNSKFDLSKKWDVNLDALRGDESVILFQPPQFATLSGLWKELCALLRRAEFSSEPSPNSTPKKFLRILIFDLSSPMWTDPEYLPTFLIHLKAFCRNANCLVLIGIDSFILSESVLKNVLRLSDAFIRLEFVSEEEQKAMSLHQKFDGRLYVLKLPTVYSAASHRPECLDLVFSLKRTHFDVKIFHLPPAIGESSEAAKNRSGCQTVQEEF